jgi:RNA polymerase sigma-70 factor (ECF subfamily)
MVTESGKNIKTLQTQVYRAKGMLKKLWRKE